MSFASLLTHTATIKRATATTGIKKTYQQVATAVPCLVQPLDPEANQTAGMAMGRGYKAFFKVDANVLEGDQLTDQINRVFGVRGIRLRNYGGQQHLDVLLEEDKKN